MVMAQWTARDYRLAAGMTLFGLGSTFINIMGYSLIYHPYPSVTPLE